MFKLHDVVCYRSSFLRSIQWHTNVPVNGRVVEIPPGEPQRVLVEWSDGDTSTVLSSNLILESRKHLESV